jgi:hypothetical protein
MCCAIDRHCAPLQAARLSRGQVNDSGSQLDSAGIRLACKDERRVFGHAQGLPALTKYPVKPFLVWRACPSMMGVRDCSGGIGWPAEQGKPRTRCRGPHLTPRTRSPCPGATGSSCDPRSGFISAAMHGLRSIRSPARRRSGGPAVSSIFPSWGAGSRGAARPRRLPLRTAAARRDLRSYHPHVRSAREGVNGNDLILPGRHLTGGQRNCRTACLSALEDGALIIRNAPQERLFPSSPTREMPVDQSKNG